MNWYIGQKVVAVKDHSIGDFKKGQTFYVKGVRDGVCTCASKLIDIGMEMPHGGASGCRKHMITVDTHIAWYSEKCFAPIEPKQELSHHTTETLIEALEEQLQPC